MSPTRSAAPTMFPTVDAARFLRNPLIVRLHVSVAAREPCDAGRHRSPPAPEPIGRTNLPSTGPGSRGPFARFHSRVAEEDCGEDGYTEEVRSDVRHDRLRTLLRIPSSQGAAHGS